jgi:hypothetical protein
MRRPIYRPQEVKPNYTARLIRDVLILIVFIVFLLFAAIGVALATDIVYTKFTAGADCGLELLVIPVEMDGRI